MPRKRDRTGVTLAWAWMKPTVEPISTCSGQRIGGHEHPGRGGDHDPFARLEALALEIHVVIVATGGDGRVARS